MKFPYGYQLQFAAGTRDGIYQPDRFTSFIQSSKVDMDSVKNRHRQDGLGGALVGTHQTSPPDPFSFRIGVTAAAKWLSPPSANSASFSICTSNQTDLLK